MKLLLICIIFIICVSNVYSDECECRCDSKLPPGSECNAKIFRYKIDDCNNCTIQECATVFSQCDERTCIQAVCDTESSHKVSFCFRESDCGCIFDWHINGVCAATVLIVIVIILMFIATLAYLRIRWCREYEPVKVILPPNERSSSLVAYEQPNKDNYRSAPFRNNRRGYQADEFSPEDYDQPPIRHEPPVYRDAANYHNNNLARGASGIGEVFLEDQPSSPSDGDVYIE